MVLNADFLNANGPRRFVLFLNANVREWERECLFFF
jgi:hypothetical protein